VFHGKGCSRIVWGFPEQMEYQTGSVGSYTPLAVVSRARKVSTILTTAPHDTNSDVLWEEGAVIGARETFIGVITDFRHRNKLYFN
jgi:hypothetical protein